MNKLFIFYFRAQSLDNQSPDPMQKSKKTKHKEEKGHKLEKIDSLGDKQDIYSMMSEVSFEGEKEEFDERVVLYYLSKNMCKPSDIKDRVTAWCNKDGFIKTKFLLKVIPQELDESNRTSGVLCYGEFPDNPNEHEQWYQEWFEELEEFMNNIGRSFPDGYDWKTYADQVFEYLTGKKKEMNQQETWILMIPLLIIVLFLLRKVLTTIFLLIAIVVIVGGLGWLVFSNYNKET